MDHFIGLDIGTSAVKGVLLSAAGETLATASGNFHYYTQKGGRLLKPDAFFTVCCDVINTLIEKAGTARIAALCSCCASGSLLLLDRAMTPMTPLIGWQSETPAKEFANYYTPDTCAKVYQTVGWPVLNGFPVAFFPWFHQNHPTMLQDAGMICMSAEYLNFKLTGQWGISHSMGTPFYLLDQAAGTYSRALLDRFGLREDQLPPILKKGTVLGTVQAAIPGLRLPVGTPVVLGSFDHPSAATGTGVYRPGEALLSCGTSWVEFFPVQTREEAIATNFLVDRYMLDGAPYCVMNSLTSIGGHIDALRHRFFGDISHKDFDALAAAGKPGCHGLRFTYTAADLVIPLSAEREDIARAIPEGAAALLKKNFDAAAAKGLRADTVTMVGGITNSPVMIDIIAKTLGRNIRVVNGVSAGAAGAAMLAAIGVGAFQNERDAFDAMHFPETIYTA